ncbi:MAG: hypothetical protein M5R42_07410 [Rhodocyclaceae bacterium]|nr:hypothetical protein [Rhodocyclaceae bacterium]
MACYRKALLLDPDNAVVRCELAHGMRHVCDWGEMEASEAWVLDMVRQGAAVGPSYLPRQRRRPGWTINPVRSGGRAARFTPSAPLVQSPRPTDGPIHIGYPPGRSAPARDRLHGRGTRAPRSRPVPGDRLFPRRRRRQRHAPGCSVVFSPSTTSSTCRVCPPHRQAAERIDADGVHILVDLGAPRRSPDRDTVAARRRYRSTISAIRNHGAPFIDYIISDAIVSPV